MVCDASISLPGNVRVERVAEVVGKLLGCESTLEKVSGSVRVDGVDIRPMDHPTYVQIIVMPPSGRRRRFNYFFESSAQKSRGANRRSMSTSSTPTNIAVLVGVAMFFGGAVDANDLDEEECDVGVLDKSDLQNATEDGPSWDDLQRRIHAIKPLTKAHIEPWRKRAAYDEED